MQAVVRNAYGSAGVLDVADVERPALSADEVLIKVHAAGLDRGAWHMMTGKPYLMRIAGFGLRRPKNRGLGSDLAGTVEAVGAEVTEFVPGDRVFGIGTNAFAELATARPGKLARMPAGLTYEKAAAVPVSAVTALQALRDQGHVQAGQHVLIIGASGGVGTFAVQIAKALGAQVTGVCSTAKVDVVRSVGADHVIDYTTGDIGADGVRYDLVLDIGGNRPLRALRRLLAPAGTLVFVGGESGGRFTGGMGRQVKAMMLSPFVGQHLGGLWIANENSADLDVVRGMIENGAITPAIDRVCALRDVPAAMQDLEAGRVAGKVVVAISTR